ncbi:cytochrome d ubiquinol oxidase subunit II [Brevibacillus borstelensis]|uniref:cytochrome d ubiquinol oxidase subunit II n=1 Tax=Brevibacillus borstelensis TaxID=45462 RepID=UPI0014907C78|nr:cytochrome d ubiquinol oxidase subunit II [Brevibacillus borstelensis]MCM3592888.1 cytochrome d ubiquinol oxidase subunit II [Brevibacillus borstelensis]NOU57418.1 cytochrome d ubiquinol oxidase subunit II [Brevibacillus borstelensis]
MALETLAITVLWIFLYGYIIIASIDFGAGFFSFFCKVTRRDHIINAIIERYLSPVWEVTNVFLIFFMVGLIGFFPDTAYYYGTALLVPGSIFLVLQSLRGSFYAFAHYGARNSTAYLFVYGVTGLFIPASLSTVLTISEGGYIEQMAGGEIVLNMGKLLTSSYSWSVVALALVSVLYISASFLTFYADRAKDTAAVKLLRSFAIAWSLPTIFASFLVFLSIHRHNPEHFDKMMDISWLFLLSFACFCGALALQLQKRSYGWAFILVMLQFAFAFFGYGMAHLPYLLYPYITITDSINSPAMGKALVIGLIAGLFLLIPSLLLLLKLFLFDAKYVQGRPIQK